jgi:hypothetical protein
MSTDHWQEAMDNEWDPEDVQGEDDLEKQMPGLEGYAPKRLEPETEIDQLRARIATITQQLEEREAIISNMSELITEAMGWNWLDDDYPQDLAILIQHELELARSSESLNRRLAQERKKALLEVMGILSESGFDVDDSATWGQLEQMLAALDQPANKEPV